jgi:hypothetical protein
VAAGKKEDKMTKISWICDHDCMIGEGGGGELSEKVVITEGIRRGHDIELCTPNTPDKNKVFKSDIVIIGSGSRLPQQFLVQVSERQEIVNYIHDFWPLCKFRLFYSDLEKCKTICSGLGLAKKLLLSSSLNIYLSPLHKRIWLRAIPELALQMSYLHVSPVDTNLFVPLDVPKIPNSSLCINCLMKFKDLENVITYAKEHPERTITCVGGQEKGVQLPPNIVPVGGVSQDQLPSMYAQSEEYLHLPNYVEPCGRSTIEAKLCDIPMKLNKLVGVASYPEFKWDRERFAAWIENSAHRFWRKLEQEVF